MNVTVKLLAFTILSIVTSSRYDHDATIDESTYSQAERIKLVRINSRHAEAEIHYADVVG